MPKVKHEYIEIPPVLWELTVVVIQASTIAVLRMENPFKMLFIVHKVVPFLESVRVVVLQFLVIKVNPFRQLHVGMH